MSKHTPGPWKYFYEGSGDYLILDDQAREIASVDDPNAHFMHSSEAAKVNEANARLIAAAPELLDACNQTITDMQGLANHSDDPTVRDIASNVANRVAAAIAKAEGRDQDATY